MDWMDVAALLYDRMGDLERSGPPGWNAWELLDRMRRQEFHDLEESHERRIAGFSRRVAKGIPLPALDGPGRLLLWVRLSWAYDLCLAMASAPKALVMAPDAIPRRKLLEWLLIGAWEAAGYGATPGRIGGSLETPLPYRPPGESGMN